MKRVITMPDGETITKDWPDWKTPYNHDTDVEARRTSTYFNDESLTKQEFKEEADINVIINRVMQTGEVPVLLPEHYLDVSKQPTYFEMQEKIAGINAYFYELPPRIRTEYANDPAAWAQEVHNAAAIADETKLKALGVKLEKPETGDQGTPPPGDSPALKASQTPPPAPPKGGAPGDDKSPPKSDTPK